MFALKKMITAAALTFAALGAQAATLTVSAPTVTTGSSVAVNVMVSDVTDLSVFQFSLAYDASLLSFASFAGGSFLGAPAVTDYGIADITSGFLDLVYGFTYAQTGVNGSGGLITLNFNTLGAGTSFLDFSNVLFLNSDADGLGDIDITAVNGSLAILPVVIDPPGGDVPEPASLLLLGAGAAAFLARRRSSATALKLAA
jgi:hypothetical protein